MSRADRLRLWRNMTAGQARLGWLPSLLRCNARYVNRTRVGTFHDSAPVGVSRCEYCGRVVIRGEGRWWE